MTNNVDHAAAGPTPRPTIRVVSCDGLLVRCATSPRPGAPVLLMLSPWPESILAYWPMWSTLAAELSLVAVDLPGFGRSEGRSDLMGPAAMGRFLLTLVDELGLSRPHVLGPDVGTSALLFAAAAVPHAFRSLQIGGGAALFPLQATGVLRTFIEAPDLDGFRSLDPTEVVDSVLAGIPGYAAEAEVRDDYIASYAGRRFADSIAYVRSYPHDLAVLAGLLPGIDVPVQVLAARDDPLLPLAEPEEMVRLLPHATLTVLEAGHNAWEQIPGVYAQHLLGSITAVEARRAA